MMVIFLKYKNSKGDSCMHKQRMLGLCAVLRLLTRECVCKTNYQRLCAKNNFVSTHRELFCWGWLCTLQLQRNVVWKNNCSLLRHRENVCSTVCAVLYTAQSLCAQLRLFNRNREEDNTNEKRWCAKQLFLYSVRRAAMMLTIIGP